MWIHSIVVQQLSNSNSNSYLATESSVIEECVGVDGHSDSCRELSFAGVDVMQSKNSSVKLKCCHVGRSKDTRLIHLLETASKAGVDDDWNIGVISTLHTLLVVYTNMNYDKMFKVFKFYNIALSVFGTVPAKLTA